MDLISEHFYCGNDPGNLFSHVRLLARKSRDITDMHREYRKQIETLKGKDIRIAMDEWNYWYAREIYGQLGTPYHLKDALGVAACLHEFFKQSDLIFMANYAQTVNVIGAIKTSKTDASMDTTGLVLQLYRQHFGVTPVAVEASEPLDVSAAWTADHKGLTIGIMNPTGQTMDISLKASGAKIKGSGRRWEIVGTDLMAHNAPGNEPAVKITETTVEGADQRLSAEPFSVTLYELDAE